MIPKRIGILIPSTNTSVEADFKWVTSKAVTAHSERLAIPDGTMTPAFLDQMNQDLAAKVASVASASMDLIAYACTSGSFYRGPAWDEQVHDLVQRTAHVPCVTTSTAVMDAFQALDVQRISVITPYPQWTNDKLAAYYGQQGMDVLGVHGDVRAAAQGHRAINDQDPDDIIQFAQDHFDPDAQALFCSCTAWRAAECVTALEAALGVPVITSNQATIWAALRQLDMLHAAQPLGRLFTRSAVC